MNEFNKKYIMFAIILSAICLTIVGILFFKSTNNNTNMNTENTTNAENTANNEEPQSEEVIEYKTKYYTCYRKKDVQTTCQDLPCTYSSYYKFYIPDKNTGHQRTSGKKYKSYKIPDEYASKFDINKFVEKNQTYEYDENEKIYYLITNAIIEYDHQDDFSIDAQLEYLKSLGFENCETSEE